MRRPNSPSSHPRRFYQEAAVAERDGGFEVRLDGRGVKTPAGAPLVLPTEALAGLVCAEWYAQGDAIDAETMPAHRLAVTVIDRTAGAGAALAREVARYAGADVLCYLAEAPQALVEAERAAWTPMLDWARDTLGVTLRQCQGVTLLAQPAEALVRVETLAAELDRFTLAGVAVAAPLFGSAILALALQRGRLDAAAALTLSRFDEAFQEARWGIDAEAAERTARLYAEAELLGRWFRALSKLTGARG